MMELVTVIIPTRNRASHVANAVTSALGQTHPRVEVVVVDDASEDDTAGILEGLAREDPRLRVLRNEVAGGAPQARNRGVAEAAGSLVAFLDDDCVYHPEKVALQLASLTQEAGASYCRQVIQQVDGAWEVEGAPGANGRPLEGLLNIGTNCLLLRKELFAQVGGFDESIPRLQDWEFLLRLSRESAFAYVPEILVRGVMVKGGITLSRGPLVKAAERIVTKHTRFLDPPLQSLLFFILGKFLLVDGHTREARRFMMKALRIRPLSLRSWMGVGATLLGPGPARILRGWRRERRSGSEAADWGTRGPGKEEA